ncbi:hypothetical protein G6F61_014176 [Rhizopus arrhizus]|nr:hypothetical protein G6F61_014176 [Rhizopus arrhizus]
MPAVRRHRQSGPGGFPAPRAPGRGLRHAPALRSRWCCSPSTARCRPPPGRLRRAAPAAVHAQIACPGGTARRPATAAACRSSPG